MNNLILVFNCGSSSLKAAVIDFVSGENYWNCSAEKLGLADAFININYQNNTEKVDLTAEPVHDGAIKVLLQKLEELNLLDKIEAVGHRVVHGGEEFTAATIIDDHVIEDIKKCIVLAPLHNPAHLLGIKAAMKVFNNIKHVAVFDTAFHQTMSPKAFMYAIPVDFYKKYGVRKYGMHGTSYQYVYDKTNRTFDSSVQAKERIVIAHLGNGASLCAVKNGKSIDTTMGLTPLEGLIMGTRSGDIDASIFSFLAGNANMSIQETTDLLYTKSGLLGVSGLSSDLRTLTEAAENGNEFAQLAIEMFVYRVAKLIGSMIVALGGLDILIFTGGIGQNSEVVREKVLDKLKLFGFEVDLEANKHVNPNEVSIISKGSKPLALVVPTKEELLIARETAAVVGLKK